MPARTSRLTLAVAAVVVVVSAASLALRWAASGNRLGPGHPSRRHRPRRATISRRRTSQLAGHEPEAAAAPPLADAGKPNDAPGADDSEGGFDAAATAWASVDFDAIHDALPDNTYWLMAAPTKDPEVVKFREEERARWNVEYGKVLSNSATEEEVDAYYAHREKLSQDYLEFIVYLLSNYGYQIPPRDVAD